MNRKFKKCLITGITGSGGSYLAEHIFKHSKKLKIYGFYRNKKKLNIIDNNIRAKLKLHKVSLLNYKQLKKNLVKIKPDLVYHLASNADVRKSFDEPMKIIDNNYKITVNLLEALRVSNINPLIIMCSTSEVYGLVNKKDIPIKENQKFQPASPYALSKIYQDLLCQLYTKVYKQKIIITRMFSYINPKRKNLFQTSFADQIAKLEFSKSNKKTLFHGNLNSIRTFVDINDAMQAYWLVAIKGKIGEIYNIGGNTIISVKTILKKLMKLSKVKIETKVDKSLLRPVDVTLQIPDSKKFIKHTKWKPKMDLENSLNKLLMYRRKINNKTPK
jgi:GDP-4-dehydro-6-deoxy-D-mannose reductase